jgi:hypothetical protein
MRYKAPGQCPVCNHELIVTKLSCTNCSTKLEGEFTSCKFCRLPGEQREFIEVFIKCRGNIKDVEKELRISYPTVRNRLDAAIEALGYRVERDEVDLAGEKEERQGILDALERGEITPQEATKQLKKLTNK